MALFTTYITATAECEYELRKDVYYCYIKNATVLTADTELEIEGEHVLGYTESDVKKVFITKSIIHYLQPTIFETFVNIEEFSSIESQIKEILPNALDSCKELKMFIIEDTELQVLPEKLFKNCQKLSELTLKAQLTVLFADTFSGLENSLENLDLSGNQIMTVTDSYFKGLIRLTSLNLGENEINGFDNAAFNDLTSLVEINLMSNSLTESMIPGKLFSNLKNLKTLDLRINLIKELNAEWFRNLSGLHALDLSRNVIDELPVKVFGALENLKFLYLDDNNLKTLQPEPFERHAGLLVLTVDNNKIQSINSKFFDSFPNIEYFHAENNVCINGFLIAYEEPINFADPKVNDMLGPCYSYGAAVKLGENEYLMWVWIGLGSAGGAFVVLVLLFVIVRRLRNRNNKITVNV